MAVLKWLGLGFFAIVVASQFGSCGGKGPTDVTTSSSLVSEKELKDAAARQAAKAAECRQNVEVLTATYEDLFKRGREWEAASVLRACAQVSGEPAFVKAVATAEIASYIATAKNSKEPMHTRIHNLDKLHAEHPIAFKPYATLYADLQRRSAAAAAAEKRKMGVTLGMSEDDVRASSWGKPRSINRSTNRWGTSEQWVYDGGYLYFKDGVLNSIQN